MYSPILILLVVVNLSLSGANGRDRDSSPNSNYEMPPYGQNDVVNIGNGVNRNNVVVLDERTHNMDHNYPNTRGRSDGNYNRFNNENPHNVNHRYPGPSRENNGWQGSVNNIGNGYQNRNTFVSVDGDRRTVIAQHNNDRNNGGTTFVSQNGRNGYDLFNVGYGPGNRNQVIVNGRPVVPDHTDSRGSTYHINRENTAGEGCYGSSCDNAPMYPRKLSNSSRTNRAVSLLLTFLSFFQLKVFM